MGQPPLFRLHKLSTQKVSLITGCLFIFQPGLVLAQSSTAAQNRVQQAYRDCLLRAAERHDDQKSPPTAVAEIILQQCRASFDRVVDIYTLGVSAEVKAQTRQKSLENPAYLGTATSIILERRTHASVSNSRLNPAPP